MGIVLVGIWTVIGLFADVPFTTIWIGGAIMLAGVCASDTERRGK